MQHLTQDQIFTLFLALGIILGVARALGELAQRLRQPAVVGELLAGVLLGPSVLGRLAPELAAMLFPTSGTDAIALDTIAVLAIVLFLLVAGMEVNLSSVWRQGRAGLTVGAFGMSVPFVIGFAATWAAPTALGWHPDTPRLTYVLFVATALSISALPVIAKTLMDMNLYRTDLGSVIISAGICIDLLGWTVFGVVLAMMDGAPDRGHPAALTVGLTLAFAVVMLTVVRKAVHRILPMIQAHSRGPGGVLGFALSLTLLGAACTEWIGIHAIFGSFLVGVAVGDSPHLRQQTRTTIEHFVSHIFAPVFFASIGLHLDFVAHFDGRLVLAVLVIACVSKLAGSVAGARLAGLARRESWAVGFALNSRGAMEIILGTLALDAGIIRVEMFVALVVMAMATSMMSGPLMRLVLRYPAGRKLADALSPRQFVAGLAAEAPAAAVRELAAAACAAVGLDRAATLAAVSAGDVAAGAGLGNGVAVPHVHLDGLKEVIVVVGISDRGIDFDAPDGEPAHVVFLLLTPLRDSGASSDLTAEIEALFRDRALSARAARAQGFAEFRALLGTPGIGAPAA